MEKSLISALITERGKGANFIEELKKSGIHEGFALHGEGTVNSEILKMLDLDYSSKDIVFCAVNAEEDKKFYDILEKKSLFTANSAGIAFSVPLEKFGFDENQKMGRGFDKDAIILITESNKRDRALEVAREHGIIGGTIISGRGAGIPQNFYFPITIEPEKSIFIFIVNRGHAKELKETFVENLNLHSPGKGMLFVLPVAKSYGIREVK